MSRFVHLSGVYACDEQGQVTSSKLFDVAERDAFTHAQATHNTEELANIIAATGITGEDAPPSLWPTILSQLPAESLREQNLRLTRESVRESCTPDSLIINAINTLEEIDKVSNSLSKRLREWYALWDPELEHAYQDHRAFVEAVLTRTSDRTPDTMGGQFSEQDTAALVTHASGLRELFARRDALLLYLEEAMQTTTPNIKRVAGPTIGAKLIAMAGSLERLSRMPSSTIQLLGAETALFRHLRNRRARPPKHGIIFNHQLLQRAPKELRGKAARALADKISIASRVDFFKGEYIGDTLYAQAEARVRGK